MAEKIFLNRLDTSARARAFKKKKGEVVIYYDERKETSWG